jgi:hypothetical protein
VKLKLLLGVNLILCLSILWQQARAEEPKMGRNLKQTIRVRLDSILIDEITFDQARLFDVLKQFEKKIRIMDPSHEGIPLKVTAMVEKCNETLDLKLKNVPASTVIKYIEEFTTLKCFIEEDGVLVRTRDDPYFQTIQTRVFEVPAKGIEKNPQEMFQQYGVKFPSGASMAYDPVGLKLTAQNIPSQLDYIEILIGHPNDRRSSSLKKQERVVVERDEREKQEIARFSEKLNSIIIDEIEFKHTLFTDVLVQLRKKAKEADPEKEGVLFALTSSLRETLEDRKATFRFKEVPLSTIIKYFTTVTGAKYKLAPGMVILSAESIYRRSYQTRKLFRVWLNVSPKEIQKYFEDRGVKFFQKDEVVYNEVLGILAVRYNPNVIDEIEEMVLKLNGEVLTEM